MTARKLSSLGAMVRKKRSEGKLRDTAKEIGIGPATLMRVEAGHVPDVTTFGKICQWLQVEPNSFLGFKREPNKEENLTVQVSAHFKAPKTLDSKTLNALAKMIFLAVQSQPESQELSGDEST